MAMAIRNFDDEFIAHGQFGEFPALFSRIHQTWASTGQYYWEDVFILGVPKTSKSNSLAASNLLIVLPQSSTIHVSIHLPMARLLSGQPGSGKSFVARQLVAELQLGDGAEGGYKPKKITGGERQL